MSKNQLAVLDSGEANRRILAKVPRFREVLAMLKAPQR